MKKYFRLFFPQKKLPAETPSSESAKPFLSAQQLLNSCLRGIKTPHPFQTPEHYFPQLTRQMLEAFRCRHVSIVLSNSTETEGYYSAGHLPKEVLEDPLVISSLRNLFSEKRAGPASYSLKHKEESFSITSYPLFYDRKVMGALSFFSNPDGSGTPELQELQSSFSHLVSLMLQEMLSASAHVSTKKKLLESQQDLATIHRISMTVNSSAPLEEIMEQIIREAATCLTPAANQGALFKVNPRKKGFTLVSQFGPQRERDSKNFFGFDEAFSLYQAYLDHRTITVNDLEKEKGKDSLTEIFSPRSYIVSPLIIHDKAVGVMFLGDTQVPHKFSLGEVSRVVTISHQLSTAIHLDSLQKNGTSQKNKSSRGALKKG